MLLLQRRIDHAHVKARIHLDHLSAQSQTAQTSALNHHLFSSARARTLKNTANMAKEIHMSKDLKEKLDVSLLIPPSY